MANTISQEKIDALNKFVMDTKEYLDGILQKLGWTKNHVMNKMEMMICPVDANHRVPVSFFDEHTKRCQMKADGYSQRDIENAEKSSIPFYENTTQVSTVIIDKQTLNGLPPDVPLTNDRAMTDLNPQERLAIHQYVIDNVRGQNKTVSLPQEQLKLPSETNQDTYNKEGNEMKTLMEIRAEMRDFKRRTKSYRAKNVHITRKSHTEVIRDVINNQMEMLENSLKEEEEEQRYRKNLEGFDASQNHDDKKNGREHSEKPTGSGGSYSRRSRERQSDNNKSDRKRDYSRSPSRSSSKRSHKHKKHKKHSKHD